MADDNPTASLLQLRRDLERFRSVVEEQKRHDSERRLQLEEELRSTQRRLADAEERLRRSAPNSLPEGATPRWVDDPLLPASERHRRRHNPPPSPMPPPVVPLAPSPTTAWGRWNPLTYIRTPFGGRVDRDGSFEFRRRAPSPPVLPLCDPTFPSSSPFSHLDLRSGIHSPPDRNVDRDVDQDEMDLEQDSGPRPGNPPDQDFIPPPSGGVDHPRQHRATGDHRSPDMDRERRVHDFDDPRYY